MAYRLDIISQLGAVGQCDFTVTDAVKSVAVTPITDPQGLPFRNSQTLRGYFELGDNPILQEIAARLPYQFGQATQEHIIGINWEDNLGNLYLIPELSGSAVIIPSLCGSIVFPGGLPVKCPVVVDPLIIKFRFVLTLVSLEVSMLGVPALVVGDVLNVDYFIQVLHSKALVV